MAICLICKEIMYPWHPFAVGHCCIVWCGRVTVPVKVINVILAVFRLFWRGVAMVASDTCGYRLAGGLSGI